MDASQWLRLQGVRQEPEIGRAGAGLRREVLARLPGFLN